MSKEEFKSYVFEAIEAMDEAEVEWLFPRAHQPDLYTLVSELTGLRGEVKKLAGASLRTHNELHAFLEQQQAALAEASDEPDPQALASENLALREELKTLLLQILEQDDGMGRAFQQSQSLPEPQLFSLGAFRARFDGWRKGFGITMSKWEVFVKSLGLRKTGLPGEPFDPERHEAVEARFDAASPPNTILETELAGFLYRQQVLRIAKVVVCKHPPPKPEPPLQPEPPMPVSPTTFAPEAEVVEEKTAPAPTLPPERTEMEKPSTKKTKEKSKRKARKKKGKHAGKR